MSFDFFSMLPPELRAELERADQREALRREHAETCEETYCATCRRVRCEVDGCDELAVLERRCGEHDRIRRDAARAAHLAELVAAQLPEAFRAASLAEPWLAELVGPVALAQAHKLAREGWATVYSPRTGAGKTTLVAAMVRERGRRDVLWTTARALATASAYSKLGEEPALLVAARAAGLLVIDELGTEAERFGSSVADVVMDRHDLRRDVWITTPLAGARLSDRYGAGLVRRLTENGEVVRLKGGGA